MSAAVAMAAVLATIGGMLVFLRWCQRCWSLPAELSRKLFHIGGGVVSLSLPWLFAEPTPVLVLTGVSTAGLLALRRVPALRDGLGRVTGSVGRLSLGEVYFPISVGVLFVLAHDEPALYCVPLLLLTFADSVAALIGVRYGRVRYDGTDGVKSWEGSVSFFLVAFLSAHVPLLLGTPTGRAESLLIAAILGLLVMMLEAVAWAGLDNLFIPLIGYGLLHSLMGLSSQELSERLLATVAFVGATLVFGRRTTLNTAAVLGGCLIGYVIWMVCGWRWVLMPAVVFVSYRWLSPVSDWDRHRFHAVQVPFWVCAAGLAWLLLAWWRQRMDLFFPYTISFAANLAVIGIVRHQLSGTGCSPWRVLVPQAVKGWLVLMVPFLAVEAASQGVSPRLLAQVALALPCVLLAACLYCLPERSPKPGADVPRWRWQALAAGLGSAGGVVLLAGGRL